MIILTLFYVAATIAITPFFLYLLMITVAALWPSRPPAAGQGGARFLFVIPAHDEEAGIAATVRSCAAVDYPADLVRVAVIADNCTDATAAAARNAGAFVVERHDLAHKSKGHALEYFFDTVPEGRPEADLYDAAVIVDADTVVDAQLLSIFAGSLSSGVAWAQGYYTVRNPDASWRTRLMTYAFSLFNGSWPLGQDRLGLSVGLKGNGMCFSAEGLRRFPWRAYGLVEDAEFGLMLKIAGERVRFLPGARVYGEMVSRGGPGAASQRRRWEAGRKSLRKKFLPHLLASRSPGMFRKALSVLDLYFPPLVTLAAGFLVAASVQVLGILDVSVPLARGLRPIQAVMGVTLVAYALSPVRSVGLPARYLASLLALPYYAAWKLMASVGRAPIDWIRTRREA